MRNLTIILCVGWMLWPGGKILSADTLQEQASRLFREGNNRYEQAEYEQALEKYRQAQSLYPSYKIDYNIASTLYALNRSAQAAIHYERFLAHADPTTPSQIMETARSRLDELAQSLTAVALSCPIHGAMVFVDGEPLGRTPIEHKIYLDPGDHQIKISHPSRTAFVIQLIAQPGLTQSISVPWTREKSIEKTPAQNFTRRKIPNSPPAEPRMQAEATWRHEYRRKSLLAYSTLGIGLAAAAAAGILYGMGGRQGQTAWDAYQNLGSEDTDAQIWEQYRLDIDAAKKKLIGGHVLLGAAVMAWGVSVYAFLTRPADLAPLKSSETAVRFDLTPFTNGAVFRFAGRF